MAPRYPRKSKGRCDENRLIQPGDQLRRSGAWSFHTAKARLRSSGRCRCIQPGDQLRRPGAWSFHADGDRLARGELDEWLDRPTGTDELSPNPVALQSRRDPIEVSWRPAGLDDQFPVA